jgi:hypothetical protein
MSATLMLSIEELEVESFATLDREDDAPVPVRLAISELAGCSEPPNCNETVNTCEYGEGCWTRFPNCNSGRSVAWGCHTNLCV